MEKFSIDGIPAVLWGVPSDKIYIYVHGKQGYKEYAEAFAKGFGAGLTVSPDSEHPFMGPEDEAIVVHFLSYTNDRSKGFWLNS